MNSAKQSPARRKLYSRCKEIGLTDEERCEFASYILRRDITSYKQLDEAQVLRLLDSIEGWELLNQLLVMRAPGA